MYLVLLQRNSFMKFEILAATNMTITVSLDVTSFCLIVRYRRFWRKLLCTLMAEKVFEDASSWFLRNVCTFVRLVTLWGKIKEIN
jgi:hypothetical protein